MSESLGRFRSKDKAATGSHQKAEGRDKKAHPLPASLEYRVPFEIGKRLRTPGVNTIDPHGTSTLVQQEVASIVYMDVGRWSGSAPTEDDTPSNWGKRRDFGIVHGRLAVLCSYTKDPPKPGHSGPVLGAVKPPIQSAPEFERLLPLLETLSSNPALGWVKVTKAVLGRKLNNETPREDRIYVFLGDLHAPVMTDPNRTYLPPPQQDPLLETGMAVQSIPGAHANAALASGAVRRIPKPPHGWWGRYDRGTFARNVLPGVARAVGETSKAALKADPITILAGAGAGAAVGAAPLAAAAVVAVSGQASAVLTEIAVQTSLRDWPDPDGGDHEAVRDWFGRYHGIPGKKKGADIFEDAGEDLLLWLGLLKQYQTRKGGKLPVRLAQLGDLFDFWIGLKCPFDLRKGARSFPRKDRAAAFVDYWLRQSLENPAIGYLWHFDEKPPHATGDLKTVFVHGNHDTYTGCLLPAGERTKERFDEDPGLVAQHGHQEDGFNRESKAAGGYLLTQAAFADDYVRTIEDPMSSLSPTFFGGSWTRLDLAEMAIESCLFEGKQPKKKRAMMFVMGHTHEPVLQVIHVVADAEGKERATSTATSTSTSTAPSPVVSPGMPPSAGQSRDTNTATAPGTAALSPGTPNVAPPEGPSTTSTKIK